VLAANVSPTFPVHAIENHGVVLILMERCKVSFQFDAEKDLLVVWSESV
jgi:hypothetical protein